MSRPATLLGVVAEVTGSAVSVRQLDSVASNLAMIDGRTYRIGQVGSFVRIPQGYHDLLGVVSEVGASVVPEGLRDKELEVGRWLRVHLVGESIGGTFDRGISQYPNVNDEVHILTERRLWDVYGLTRRGHVPIGHLASAEGLEVCVDLQKLVTRHAAVLGSTGTGKSTTVASLFRSLAAPEPEGETYPSARILLFDIHGEYAKALGDVATVFRINPYRGEEELCVPYWAIEFGELIGFLAGPIAEDKALHFHDRIVTLKTKTLSQYPLPGADPASLTVDTPVPFSLKQLWYDLIDQELVTFEGANRDQPTLQARGDAEALKPP